MRKKFEPLIASPTHRERCLYCGEIASCREHYLPWAISENRWWVPACRECNRLLNTKLHETLSERADYLLQRYEQKYRDVIGCDYEGAMDGTVGTLRRTLRGHQVQDSVARSKILHLDFWVQAGRQIVLADLSPGSECWALLNEFLDVVRRF